MGVLIKNSGLSIASTDPYESLHLFSSVVIIIYNYFSLRQEFDICLTIVFTYYFLPCLIFDLLPDRL